MPGLMSDMIQHIALASVLFLAFWPLSPRMNPALFKEHTIASDLKGGYQVVAVDVNHDGKMDLIALASVYIYWADDPKGNRWSRQILDDGGMAAASCVVADLNGDRRVDIACIGAATANLKWYENLDRSK